MNVTMKLTMDGMLKALRGFVHDLADELERTHREEFIREEEPLMRLPRIRRDAVTERLADGRRR